MLAKRIIPCLDVKNGVVVKGVQFRNHEVMGGIVELAKRYADEGADELVFYDITASSDARVVDKSWVRKIAEVINIPFCVAGGIRSVEDAARILEYGADKISINSPALADPTLITRLANRFGVQCVVCGIICIREITSHTIARHTMERIISICRIDTILTQESRKLVTLAVLNLNVIEIVGCLYIIRQDGGQFNP